MPADEDVSELTIWWLLALAVLVLVTVGVAWKFALTRETITSELFAALCEASVGVLFVGGAFSLHRRSIARSQKNIEIVQSIVRATGDAENALMLIRSHKSILSWKNELQALVQVKNQLVRLEHEMLSTDSRAAAGHLGDAIRVIDELQSEYESQHAPLTVVQSSFELKHSGAPPASKVEDLPRHWKEILGSLKCLDRVLTKEDSTLLVPMRTAIRLMRA